MASSVQLALITQPKKGMGLAAWNNGNGSPTGWRRFAFRAWCMADAKKPCPRCFPIEVALGTGVEKSRTALRDRGDLISH